MNIVKLSNMQSVTNNFSTQDNTNVTHRTPIPLAPMSCVSKDTNEVVANGSFPGPPQPPIQSSACMKLDESSLESQGVHELYHQVIFIFLLICK